MLDIPKEKLEDKCIFLVARCDKIAILFNPRCKRGQLI
jgi:hypothetical protein